MNTKIWLSPPHLSGFESEFIQQAFKNNYVAPAGSNIEHFENDLEKYLSDCSNVTAVSSGTAAIHLALILLGIKSDDEVLCQTKTIVGYVIKVSYLGRVMIFVSSDSIA